MGRKTRWLLGSAAVLGVLLLIAVGGFVFWATNVPAPMPDVLAALESNGRVTVNEDKWLVFRPATGQPDTGFIFYPGGRIDPRAYATIAREIAAEGFLVVIVPMPLNLAITNANAANDVIAAYPEVRSWAIGGHSLGGAMAARYVYNHPEAVDGLVLWAAYPAESDDLSEQQNLAIASIYGTEDGLATVEKVESSHALLPQTSYFVAIEGGNHAQFGSYGDQSGDGPATISRQKQQTKVALATLRVLNDLQAVAWSE
jgi:predicted alpha/beta-hydrolase family hydrolase